MSIAQALFDKWQGNALGLREEYRQKLMHGVWVVEFTKVDGTPAAMECTLDPKHLPASDPKERGVPNEAVLGVYSLDRGGWRSFRVDNVTRFYPKPEAL